MPEAIPDVLCVRDIAFDQLQSLAARYGIGLEPLADGAAIEFSFWGEPEAGISSAGVQFRADTPVHSFLHELCHIVCMGALRRGDFARHAGGTAAEECAVCYLQVLLADHIDGYSADRCVAEMDRWGYSFREGGAAAWFVGDGRDARQWLRSHRLIDADERPTWRLRE